MRPQSTPPPLPIEELRTRIERFADADDAARTLESGSNLDHLTHVGEQIFASESARAGRIESKASTILGFATAGLAFVLGSRQDLVDAALIVVLTSGALLLLAAACAAHVLRVQRRRVIGASTWLPEPGQVTDLRHLKQTYLLEIVDLHADTARQNDNAAQSLWAAQLFLSVAALGLFTALILKSS